MDSSHRARIRASHRSTTAFAAKDAFAATLPPSCLRGVLPSVVKPAPARAAAGVCCSLSYKPSFLALVRSHCIKIQLLGWQLVDRGSVEQSCWLLPRFVLKPTQEANCTSSAMAAPPNPGRTSQNPDSVCTLSPRFNLWAAPDCPHDRGEPHRLFGRMGSTRLHRRPPE